MDMKEYIKSNEGNWLTKDVVSASQTKKVVVMPAHEWRELITKEGEKFIKPMINVEMDSVIYEWTMSKKAAKNLVEELGEDMDAWTGSTIKVFVDGAGDYQFVNGIVIQKVSIN